MQALHAECGHTLEDFLYTEKEVVCLHSSKQKNKDFLREFLLSFLLPALKCLSSAFSTNPSGVSLRALSERSQHSANLLAYFFFLVLQSLSREEKHVSNVIHTAWWGCLTGILMLFSSGSQASDYKLWKHSISHPTHINFFKKGKNGRESGGCCVVRVISFIIPADEVINWVQWQGSNIL